jgi:hypothetical protein
MSARAAGAPPVVARSPYAKGPQRDVAGALSLHYGVERAAFAGAVRAWQHRGVFRISRRVFVGLVAGIVLSLHTLAVPTSAGACAEASLHHATSTSVADGVGADTGDHAVEAHDAQVGRDLRAPQPRHVTVQQVPAQEGAGSTMRYCFSPAPPDLSELSLWRT